jgi:hypothetical protein
LALEEQSWALEAPRLRIAAARQETRAIPQIGAYRTKRGDDRTAGAKTPPH